MTELEKLQEKVIQEAYEKIIAEINANIWGNEPPSDPKSEDTPPLPPSTEAG